MALADIKRAVKNQKHASQNDIFWAANFVRTTLILPVLMYGAESLTLSEVVSLGLDIT